MWSLHLAILGFGLTGLFGKWLPYSPVMITAGRAGFGALTLLGILLWRRERLWVPWKDAAWLALTGAVLAGHWSTFFHSIQVSSVAIGLMAFSSSPVFTVLVEPWVFRERLRPVVLAAVGVVVLGLVLIATSGESLSWESQTLKGVAWGLVAGMLHGFLGILNRLHVRSHSALRVGFIQDGVAALLLLPFAVHTFAVLTATDWLLVLLLGTVLTAGAHGLLIHVLKFIQAQVANLMVAGLEPVYGILLALVLLGEVPVPQALLGGGLIIASTLYITLHPSGD